MSADWVMVVITVVYVIATIVIMCANLRTNKYAKKQMMEGQKQYNNQQRLSIRPYLNAYIAREKEHLDGNKHYQVEVDVNQEGKSKNYREMSIRNIGNGTAKDIEIMVIHSEQGIKKKLPRRNGFLLTNKQYVYDIHFNELKTMNLECKFTDLYDNKYSQRIDVFFDSQINDIISRTYNPKYIGD